MHRIPAAALSAALVIVATSAHAQVTRTDSLSAPVRDVRYEVSFTRAMATDRRIDVAMTFATDGTDPVILSIPAWTPGAYEISNFSRWVTGFAPTGDGHPLSWDKTDYDSWRIRPNGAKAVRVELSYAVPRSLDNAMNWIRPDLLMFNGTNIFPYAEGQSLDFPSMVTIRTEPGWRVATGMKAAAGGGGIASGTDGGRMGPRFSTYSSANYHDLVDMPFLVGSFDVDSAQVVDRWVRLVTYPAKSVTGPARETAWDQIKRVIPPEAAVFHDVPWETYTIMQIVDSTMNGASGLEHQNSHLNVLAPPYVGSEFQPSLYAHEIFHSWNVKRLRPTQMWPYVYSHSQPTPWLWVSEGITDYYADLAMVRGGVVDARGFYGLSAAKMNEVTNAPPVALDDASLSTWIQPVDGTGYLYYPKGSLAGLMLDIIIRDASDNKRSLDDVMRELYETTYRRGRGFTAEDWWGAVSRAAGGRAFSAFNERYIDGREAFPWDSILPMAGLRSRREHVPRLGVSTQPDSAGVAVAAVEPGSAAAAAGVRAGDYLLAVGDIAVEDQDFGAKMRARYAAMPEGSPLTIKVRRGTQTLTLAGRLKFAPGDVAIEADPRASPKAVRVREGILKGIVGN
jgi:predicted metalloprotease with PDZ domain